jgi:hypothetical protein
MQASIVLTDEVLARWAGMQMSMAYVESIQSLREAFDLDLTDLKIPIFMPCGAPCEA